MKIIVNNKEEQKVIERFIKLLQENEGFETLEIDEAKTCKEYDLEPILGSDDYTLLRDNLYESIIEVDSTESEMYFDNTDIVTGTCIICGGLTVGLIDGEDLSYSKYIEYMGEEQQKVWECELCYCKEE